MTRNLLLVSAAILACGPAAMADRIYLKSAASSPAASRPAADDQLPWIEGVVVGDAKDLLTIRMEGGEVTLPRSQVAKIETGGLALPEIERRETEAASRPPSSVDQAKRTAHAGWVDAVARKREEIRLEEAKRDEPIEVVVDFRGLIPSQRFRFYDPVLHIVRYSTLIEQIDVNGLAQVVEAWLREEVRRLEQAGASSRGSTLEALGEVRGLYPVVEVGRPMASSH